MEGIFVTGRRRARNDVSAVWNKRSLPLHHAVSAAALRSIPI